VCTFIRYSFAGSSVTKVHQLTRQIFDKGLGSFVTRRLRRGIPLRRDVTAARRFDWLSAAAGDHPRRALRNGASLAPRALCRRRRDGKCVSRLRRRRRKSADTLLCNTALSSAPLGWYPGSPRRLTLTPLYVNSAAVVVVVCSLA